MKIRNIKVSVITLTWNSEKYIYDFLTSILKDLKSLHAKYEIIVVDNHSTDNTVNIINQYFERDVVLVQLEKNCGTTMPRNIALTMSSGEYILIVDSDTVIPLHAIKGLINAFSEIPSNKIGLVAPKLVYPDFSFQESARKFPTLASKFQRFFNLEKLRVKSESINDVINLKPTKVEYAISAAWMFKRSILSNVGMLDEKYFYAPEDADFCMRIWQEGLEVWFYPSVQIIHNCQRVSKKKIFSKLFFAHIKGLLRFWFKYGFNPHIS